MRKASINADDFAGRPGQYRAFHDGVCFYQSSSLYDAACALHQQAFDTYMPWQMAKMFVSDFSTRDRWSFIELMNGGFMDDVMSPEMARWPEKDWLLWQRRVFSTAFSERTREPRTPF